MSHHPWDRRARESEEAYAAFVTWRDLGAERTHAAVVERLSKSRQILSRWKKRWQWDERATAWDNHVQAELDRATVADRQKWQQRRLAARESQYSRAEALLAKADKMLEWPLARTKSREPTKDGEIVVLEPMKWSMVAAVKMIQLGVTLEAESIGEPVAPAADPAAAAAAANPQQAAIAARMIEAGLKAAAELSGKPLDEPPPE